MLQKEELERMAEDTDNGRDSLETYLLLVCVVFIIIITYSNIFNRSLADSALPTGGFVASSGLESSVQHGFVSSSSSSPFGLLSFVRESLSSYARLNLPFLDRAHRTVQNYHLRSSSSSSSSSSATTTTAILQDTVESLLEIDGELESMMLNHVARRASKAQGIALLTLYSRAFAEVHVPSSSSLPPANGHTIPDPAQHATATVMTDLIDALKLASRGKGKGKGEGAVGAAARMQGHLPVCFAVLTAALGLPLGARSFTSTVFSTTKAHRASLSLSLSLSPDIYRPHPAPPPLPPSPLDPLLRRPTQPPRSLRRSEVAPL